MIDSFVLALACAPAAVTCAVAEPFAVAQPCAGAEPCAGPDAAATVGDGAGVARADAPASRALEIGAVAPVLEFVDTRWLRRSLADFGSPAAYVVALSSIDCPVAARVVPRIAALEREYRARGVAFALVDVGAADALVDVAARAIEAGVEFTTGRDFDGAVVRALGAERTPELFVFDAARVLRYRGRFDARERMSGTVPGDVRADLQEALDDVLAKRAVRVERTIVEGCRISAESKERTDSAAPSWTHEIAPIVAEHCVGCHSSAGSATFALTTHAEASAKHATIAEVVEQGRMPPWYASGPRGAFENERGLSAREREFLLEWCDAGAPRGEGDEPSIAPRATPSGWRIGEPDLVLQAPNQQTIPASGRVPYRYVVLPHLFLHDTWIEAIEIKPSNARVVHHANLGWWKLGGEFTNENFLTGHVPGGDAMVLDPGVATLVPAGSVVGVQIHYVATGREETDRIAVGFRFPRKPVEKRLRLTTLADMRFEIPPFAPAHPVSAVRTFKEDAVGVGLFVHMHLRGRDMRVDAIPDGGERETLLFVPNYSFDWQQSYRWPSGTKAFGKGTKVEALAHFDNSKSNPWNPDPSKAVRFGQETDDEMMYAFLFWVSREEKLGLRVDPETGQEAH